MKGEFLKISITSDLAIKQQLQLLLKCEFGIDVNFDEIPLLWDKAAAYIEKAYPDPYVRGQATALILTIVLPPITKAIQAGKLTQLVNKFKTLKGFASEATNLDRIVAAEVDDVGGVLDDLAKGSNGLINGLSGSIKSTYDDLIKAGLKGEEKASSILLKNSKGETVAIINQDKLTPVKWKAEYKSKGIRTQTSEGYVILNESGDITIELGFKEGRTLTAEEVNNYWEFGRSGYRPYNSGTQVGERLLRKGEKVYVVEYINQSQPGLFGSKDRIKSISELRDNLAVLKNWKDQDLDFLIVREYEVIKETKIREGIIGAQIEESGINKGKTLLGGGHQYEFLQGRWDELNNPSDNYIKWLNNYELR